MSRFNVYAKQLDGVAREAFQELNEAKAALDRATDKCHAYPEKRGVVDSGYAAKAARANADFIEARDRYEARRRSLPDKCDGKISEIRETLERSISAYYEVKPDHVDGNALELLKSGIMRPDDYAAMFNNMVRDENFTMLRLVGKFAADAAAVIEKKDGANAPDAIQLRTIANNARTYNGDVYRQAFGYLVDTFNRTMKNHAMIPHWDELTAETVDKF